MFYFLLFYYQDHHCPVSSNSFILFWFILIWFCCNFSLIFIKWINTCCGHKNHASFVYFLFFAPLGCIHASIVLGSSIYRAIFRVSNITSFYTEIILILKKKIFNLKSYYVFYGIKEVPLSKKDQINNKDTKINLN